MSDPNDAVARLEAAITDEERLAVEAELLEATDNSGPDDEAAS